MNITDRQFEVLRLIAAHERQRHAPPSIRWLCDRLGISSPNGIMTHVRALIRKGLMQHEEHGQARSYHVAPDGWHALGMLAPAEIEATMELLVAGGAEALLAVLAVEKHRENRAMLPSLNESASVAEAA